MNYPHIAQKLYGEPWAITPAAHASMQQVFEAHLNGDKTQQVIFTRNQFNAAALVLDPPRDRTSRVYRRGRLAYVPVHGIIGKGLSLMEEICGGYSIDQLEKDLDECNADAAVSRILLDFNSPGGQISGVPETARLIAASPKETFGFTARQSDSAAYWLMSQCDHIYCTQSAETGSIGVYLAVYDKTEMMKKAGVSLTLIRSGKHKGMGMPGNPLTEEQIQMLQDQVDMIFAEFSGAILAKRPNVTKETMQGQAFIGNQCLKAHLVDALTTSLGDLVARLS
jgi:signal peptide peptidase SppA